MFTEEKLEQHYSSIPSDALHIIRDEYKWALEECGVHNDEQLRYIEKALSMRGESLAVRLNRKILFLCKWRFAKGKITHVCDPRIQQLRQKDCHEFKPAWTTE